MPDLEQLEAKHSASPNLLTAPISPQDLTEIRHASITQVFTPVLFFRLCRTGYRKLGHFRRHRKPPACGHRRPKEACPHCKQSQQETQLRDQHFLDRQARQQWRASFEDDPIDLTRLPAPVVKKARHILAQLEQGVHYSKLQGRPLKACKRKIIRIPLGRNYRMLCRWLNGRLKPFVVLSHADYNGWLKGKRG